MTEFIFVTGNQAKAKYLGSWLEHPVEHQKCDLDEIQSLDLREVVSHKAHEAYKKLGQAVLVEDVALTFHAWGRLPGTLIKWHLEELGTDKLAEMMRPETNRGATASIAYGLYDGQSLQIFEGDVEGTIVSEPRSAGESAWKGSKSWNSLFVPDGSDKTYAEMSDEELRGFSHRFIAIQKLSEYLRKTTP